MDRKFALWFGVPTFAATVCLVVVAYFAPTLFSDSTFLVITFSVLGLGSVVGCIHAFLSIKARNASPLTALHPGVWLPLVVIFGFIADVWGVRSALWRYATTSSLETEGIWFARADDGHFRPRVSVDGNILQVVVDPESRHILLSRADATRIGIDLSAAAFDVPVDSPDGPQLAAAITLKKVQLLSVAMTDVPAFVPDRDLAVSILGREFLDRTRDWGIKGDTLMVLP
jgi:clan AA aspartic protease (TIGR02281 family)